MRLRCPSAFIKVAKFMNKTLNKTKIFEFRFNPPQHLTFSIYPSLIDNGGGKGGGDLC